MARYSLFVLKVPLNPKQTNKQSAHMHALSRAFSGHSGSSLTSQIVVC